jgi:tetratricopeptide (TPR) repeat protein
MEQSNPTANRTSIIRALAKIASGILLCACMSLSSFASDTTQSSFAQEFKLGRASMLPNPQEAIAHFTKCIEIDPGKWVAYEHRGYVQYKEHQYDKALNDYKRAIYLAPLEARLYSNRSMVYEATHKDQLELKDLSQAVKLDPKSVQNWEGRAMFYLWHHKYDQAIADFSKAIEIDPSYGACRYRATLYKMQGKRDLALADIHLMQQTPANGTIGTPSDEPPLPKEYTDDNGIKHPMPKVSYTSPEWEQGVYDTLEIPEEMKKK